MSQPIQAPARGLQDLLGLTSFGSNPRELAADVQPTIDMGALYSVDKLSVLRANYTLNGSNEADKTISLEVPAGQTWFIKKFFVAYSLLSGNNEYYFRTYIEPQQNQGPLPQNQDAFLLGAETYESGSPAVLRFYVRVLDLDLYVPSGFKFVSSDASTVPFVNVEGAVGALGYALNA